MFKRPERVLYLGRKMVLGRFVQIFQPATIGFRKSPISDRIHLDQKL